jgi:hypothetical protein
VAKRGGSGPCGPGEDMEPIETMFFGVVRNEFREPRGEQRMSSGTGKPFPCYPSTIRTQSQQTQSSYLPSHIQPQRSYSHGVNCSAWLFLDPPANLGSILGSAGLFGVRGFNPRYCTKSRLAETNRLPIGIAGADWSWLDSHTSRRDADRALAGPSCCINERKTWTNQID